MRPRPAGATLPPETRGWTQFVMVSCAAALLVIGVMPQLAVTFARAGEAPFKTLEASAAASPPAPAATDLAGIGR
jgi:hypothetical protein